MNTRDMTEQQRIIWRTADFLERLPFLLPEGEYDTLRQELGGVSNEMAEFKQTIQYAPQMAPDGDDGANAALSMLANRCRSAAELIRHPELYSIINYLHRAAMQCEKTRSGPQPMPEGENIIDFSAWHDSAKQRRKPGSSGLISRSQANGAQGGNVIYPDRFTDRIANTRSAL